MKKIVSIFFPLLLCAESPYLNSIKDDQLRLDKEKLKEDSSKLRYDWVNPLTGSYSESKNNDYDPNQYTKTYGISVSQPIFRSGGIWYAIKYANKYEEQGELANKIKEKELIKSAISLIQTLRKFDLQIKKQGLLVENAKIDIFRKRELFNSGLADSGTLDRAILDKNTYETQLLEIETQRSDMLKSLKDISDADYKSIELPVLEALTKEQYMDRNMLLKQMDAVSEQQRYRRNAYITSFLPALSLNANYYHQKIENSPLATQREGWNDYATVGFSVSMPIDLVTITKVEVYRIDYLKSSLDAKEQELKEQNLFENLVAQIGIVDKKLKLAESDYALYEGLLKDVKDRLEAGEKTQLDVDTLANSKNIKELDKKIYAIDRQIKLLEIYAKVENEGF